MYLGLHVIGMVTRGLVELNQGPLGPFKWVLVEQVFLWWPKDVKQCLCNKPGATVVV